MDDRWRLFTDHANIAAGRYVGVVGRLAGAVGAAVVVVDVAADPAAAEDARVLATPTLEVPAGGGRVRRIIGIAPLTLLAEQVGATPDQVSAAAAAG